MTRTSWRGNQQNKKASFEAESASKSRSIQATNKGHATRKHVNQRLFPPLRLAAENEELKAKIGEDEEMESNDFDSGSEHGLDILCNMIFVLPLKYDTIYVVYIG